MQQYGEHVVAVICTENEREQIEKFYLELDQFAEIKMKEEFADDMFGSDFPFDEEDDYEEQNLDSDKEYQRIQEIKNWDDQKIKKTLANKESGYEFLQEAFYIGTKCSNIKFILRIWDLAPKAFQAKMAKQFLSDTGTSFYSMIDDFRQAADEMHDSQKEDIDEGEDGDNSNFSYAGQKKSKSANLHADDEKRLKLLYRQLARKIHPDIQNLNIEDNVQSWMKSTWERLQRAYQEKNLTEMEKIYGLTLLRLKDLQGLSFLEMNQCQEWLLEDFKNIEKHSKHLAHMPAWGFSAKKNYDSLRKKIKKEIQTASFTVEEQIEELSEFHDFLKRMSKTSRPPQKKKQNRKKKKHNKHLKSQKDEHQRFFFD